MNIAHWAEMGGYAAYVWPAYGVSFVGIVGAVVWTLREWRRVRHSLDLLEELKERER